MARRNRRTQKPLDQSNQSKETSVSETKKSPEEEGKTPIGGEDGNSNPLTGSEDTGPVEKPETPEGAPSGQPEPSKSKEDSQEDKVLSTPAGNKSAGKSEKEPKKETKAKESPSQVVEGDIFYIPLLNFKRAFEEARPAQQETCRLQLSLYGLYLDILKQEPAKASASLKVLLGYMLEHKDIFDDVNLFLYPYGWTKGRSAYERYTALSTLFLRTRDPKTRKNAMGKISIDKILNKGFSETERNNLVRFYV